MSAGNYWSRPARAERYRPSSPEMERALANLTGKTSATLGDLIALAGLGAEVFINSRDGDNVRLFASGLMKSIAKD